MKAGRREREKGREGGTCLGRGEEMDREEGEKRREEEEEEEGERKTRESVEDKEIESYEEGRRNGYNR